MRVRIQTTRYVPDRLSVRAASEIHSDASCGKKQTCEFDFDLTFSNLSAGGRARTTQRIISSLIPYFLALENKVSEFLPRFPFRAQAHLLPSLLLCDRP